MLNQDVDLTHLAFVVLSEQRHKRIVPEDIRQLVSSKGHLVIAERITHHLSIVLPTDLVYLVLEYLVGGLM